MGVETSPDLRESREVRKPYPYEAIVVMPYSSGPNRKKKEGWGLKGPDFELTYESKMAAIAALEAFRQKKADKIILLGEKTIGSESNTTDELMEKFLVAKGIPQDAIKRVSNLNNTFQQITKLSEIQKVEDKFLVVALEFHKPRVKQVLEDKNVKADVIEVEKLLTERNPNFETPINKWKSSDGLKKIENAEVKLRVLSRIDTMGLIQNLVTRIQGPRKPLTDFPHKPETPVQEPK